MKARISILAVSVFAAFAVRAAVDLGELFADEKAWTVSAELFAAEHATDGFRFASEARDIVNCLNHETCMWYGLKVWEAKVYFAKAASGGVRRVELSLYNRGDAGGETIDVAALKERIAAVEKVLASDGKAAKPDKTTLRNGSVRYRRLFDAGERKAELVWGLSPLDADNRRDVDYLRLTLAAKDAFTATDGGTKRAAGATGKTRLKDNVVRGANGDVYVDKVPMVDQGQKGYCAAAVSERVLRYYGNTVDEHEIAQQAGTTAEGGTSVSAMKEVVRTVGEKQGLGYQLIVTMTAEGGIREEIARYNKVAKFEQASEIAIDDFIHDFTIDVPAIREAMEPKVVYRMRRKDSRMKKFLAGVRQQVNAGIPVFWGVTLGLWQEPGMSQQTSGGHMRLIIGYNDKTKEILYTDTWGEGHELKRMPEDWAFTITHDAFFLKPR